MVKIIRKNAWGDSLRKYDVHIDEKLKGTIDQGKHVSFDLSIGEHTLYLKVDNARSKKINFIQQAGKETVFECQSNITGLRILLLPLYITIWRNKYIQINILNK